MTFTSEFQDAQIEVEAARTGSQHFIKGPELTVPVPVDKTSLTRVQMPWLLLEKLGITTDAAFTFLEGLRVYAPAPSGNARDANSNARLPGQAFNDNKKVSFRRIHVALEPPYQEYTTTHTNAVRTRKLKHLSFRCPLYVPILALGCWFYNAPSAAKRPRFFSTEREIYNIIPITIEQLGEKSNKVELPEAQQVPFTEVKDNFSKKKRRAPK